MTLSLLFPHKIKNPNFDALAQDYLKLASRYVKIQLQIAPLATPAGTPSPKLLQTLDKGPTFLLSERGRTVDTPWFVETLKMALRTPSGISFVVGDAFGYPQGIEPRIAGLISLTPLTLPHEFALVILLEQLWRAAAILNHHPYHK